MDKAQKSQLHGRYKYKWRRLLCQERVNARVVEGSRNEDVEKEQEVRSEVERDYERIVFSPSFRRLAGKTQVRTFPDVDFIHNRLTHSIEVAIIARSLGVSVAQFLIGNGDVYKKDIGCITERIAWICQAAGAAHDLGNPPYGHSGEFAIQHWCKTLDPGRMIFPENPVWKDFLYYDGNAQSFRMVCSLETRNGDAFCFTAASAGALVKYPRDVTEISERSPDKKFDVFSNDRELYRRIWRKLGLSVEEHQRHPLSYLSEAADDICYRVLDFEDAVVSGVVSRDEVVKAFRSALSLERETRANKLPMYKLRGKIIRMLVNDFLKVFTDNYVKIMEGDFPDDLRSGLPSESPSKKFLDEMGRMYDCLYTEHNKVVRECGAYSQIPIVLNRGYDAIREAFLLKKQKRNLPRFKHVGHCSQQFITLAWGKDYYERNRTKEFEWWMHMLLDYVVGMTDSYIDMLSKKLV